MNKYAFFVAATGQHVGKTTSCLGLLAGLKNRGQKVGFMKPIGQQFVIADNGHKVDKDAVLFHSLFNIEHPYSSMSPLVISSGVTRDFLDGRLKIEDLKKTVQEAFDELLETSQTVVVEGSGHMGVGSIVSLSNAHVAALLNLPVILVIKAGLGSSFDEFMLNYTLAKAAGCRIAGVIVNRVIEEKREMIRQYLPKALKPLGVPILGYIPYQESLTRPMMSDFESLFNQPILGETDWKKRHFDHIYTASSTPRDFTSHTYCRELVIVDASREDFILSLANHYHNRRMAEGIDLMGGLILTGQSPPSQDIFEQVVQAGIPVLYTPLSHFEAIHKIDNFVSKIRMEDTSKIQEAMHLVEQHIDFDLLLSQVALRLP
jgi:phosphate acetyltransferase